MPVATSCLIRPAVDADFTAIARIYGHHVVHGAASFELEPPSPDELRSRRRSVVGQGFPFLVAVADGAVLGYGYVSLYRTRPAYRHTVEDSVYVAPEALGRGIGSALLPALIREATALGCRQMIAVIGDSANAASIGLHRSCGFSDAGRLLAVGWKHGRWVDSVLMQRALGAGAASPAPAPVVHKATGS